MHLVKQTVEAHGLVGRADLNGQRGIVLSYVEDKSRCAVKFGESEEAVLVKPANLRKVDLELPDVSDVCPAADTPVATSSDAALIEQIRVLKLASPEATAKQLHEKLQFEPGMSGVTLSEVKKAASKATKAAARANASAPPTKPQPAANATKLSPGPTVRQ